MPMLAVNILPWMIAGIGLLALAWYALRLWSKAKANRKQFELKATLKADDGRWVLQVLVRNTGAQTFRIQHVELHYRAGEEERIHLLSEVGGHGSLLDPREERHYRLAQAPGEPDLTHLPARDVYVTAAIENGPTKSLPADQFGHAHATTA